MTTEDFLPYREPRQSAIELLVIHCNIFDKKTFLYWMNYYKTSCHYYISERGEISQLVQEEDKAYHAGIGTWRGKENINDRSIGIELENSTLGQTEYKKEQISALIRLSQNLIKKYNIKPENIIGHSDSAPTRKADPGLCFPWKELSKEGLNKFFIRRLKEDMKDWNGHPLYKNRFTKTISYQLTPEEKYLYDQVTNYLTRRKEEATEEKNIHVSLALAVMQRRLVSSIYAIKNTLYKRWNALQGIVDEVNKNPNIWKQRQKLELIDVDNIDQYDDLEDDEKDALDNILSDPKKFKLFTTSKSLAEIANEAQEVKRLYDIANHLYNQNQEEKKYIQLKELLKSQGVINGQKLVIFTEHKDTLTYLQERLTNNGYKVSVIHGGLSVDERRAAQWEFMSPETQILIATDAAGEGINLQFCRLLINWDIPWNPNRLEQRMGRIHRYGQKEDVLVFNLVADNTREGQVLAKLLNKLDIIRESMGDDRVYDVIQDVLKDVSLEAIIASVFDGKESDLDRFLAQNNQEIEKEFKCQIEAQQKAIAHSPVDYKNARLLKEDSDEKRLQPIYIQLFFERTFKYLGGRYENVQKGIYKITNLENKMCYVGQSVNIAERWK